MQNHEKMCILFSTFLQKLNTEETAYNLYLTFQLNILTL
jgi:hypothetical protein